MNNYKTLRHSKFLIQYHIIWCPKYRFNVLKGEINCRLKELLIEISQTYGYDLIEYEVMPDHIHIFVSVKPTVTPTDIVRTYKSITAIRLFKEFPKLKEFYKRCGSLWSKGYFVCSVGNVSAETVKRYI